MKTHLFIRAIACNCAVAWLIGSSGCSSMIQASRMAIPESAVAPVDESVLERTNRLTRSSTDRNQPFSGSYGTERTFPRPAYLLSMGYQWVFVQKDTQPNGQPVGYWVAVPPGQEHEFPE